MNSDKNLNNIYNNRIFRNVLPNDVKLNFQPKNLHEFSEGDIVFQMGDNSDYFYLLIQGHVKIKVYGSFGGSSQLRKHSNDFFGEKELLEKIPRKSTAMAVEDSLIYFITAKEFKDLNKNKIIRDNLFNPDLPDQNTIKKFTTDDNSDVKEISPADEAATLQSGESGAKSFDGDDIEDDLSWNSSNINEIKDILNGDELWDDEEVDDYSLDDLTSETDNEADHKAAVQNEIKNVQMEIEPTQASEKQSAELSKNFEDSISNTSTETAADNNFNEVNWEQSTSTSESSQNQKIIESISVEILTPVEQIKNSAEILIQKSSSAEANRLLKKIIKQSNLIVSSLQMHTNFYSEKLELKTKTIPASKVLNETLHLLAGYTESQNVRLFRKFEVDASILVDEKLFYQACLQIVKFICQNRNKDENIYVTLGKEDDFISTNFATNSGKISSEELAGESAEQPFFETPGLALAKRAAVEHNGRLTVLKNGKQGIEIKLLIPVSH